MTSKPQIRTGVILAGRWQIEDFIGSGDTGEVYGVRDRHGSATFALKLFWPSALSHPEVWSEVQQAARTAAALGAEGVARAYEFGIDANAARPFYVSERVSWSALDERVRAHGTLTPSEIRTMLDVLARALDAAHTAGVVHRDLKPANVFVSPDHARWVRITDFGVAHLRSTAPPPPGWGGPIGWAAPEATDPNAPSIPAMDVFALGLVTFFALTGGALHRAARGTPIEPDALRHELMQPLDSASRRAQELGATLDPAFDVWFQRAVAPLAQARFSSIAEMARAFDAIVSNLAAPRAPDAFGAPEAATASSHSPALHADFGAYSPAPVPRLEGSAVAAQSTSAEDARPPGVPGARKRGAAAWLIGGAALCLALTAWGVGTRHRQPAAAGATSAAASANVALAASAPPAASLDAAVASAAPEVSATKTTAPPAMPAAPALGAKAAAKTTATPKVKAAAAASAKPVLVASKAAAVRTASPVAKVVVPTSKPAMTNTRPTLTPSKPASASAARLPAAPLPVKAATKAAPPVPAKKK